jgi:hypothetical protein
MDLMSELQMFLKQHGLTTGILFALLMASLLLGLLAFRKFSLWLLKIPQVLEQIKELKGEVSELERELKALQTILSEDASLSLPPTPKTAKPSEKSKSRFNWKGSEKQKAFPIHH